MPSRSSAQSDASGANAESLRTGETGSESAALRNVSASPPERVSPPPPTTLGMAILPPPQRVSSLTCCATELGAALDGGVGERERERECELEGELLFSDENRDATRHDHHDTESVESTTSVCAKPLLFESAVLRAGGWVQ